MEPALSNSCYDKAGVCSWVVNNHCYLNQDVCKKVRTFRSTKEMIIIFTQQSCGLCGNQTAALSNTCYDKNKQCPEVVKQRGGCHRNGELCRKVRLQLKVPCIHRLSDQIQNPELWTL